ncbi:MAG: shikimate dehydrogenase [Lachnospiraceae bacterium]|nr:shikimate dehydrogenase [Lachnospiraceae bacterium]
MTIDAKTKVCGLIGYPVGHSVSPVIHNNLAEMYGHNLVYVPLPVEPGKLKSAIAGAEAFGFAGMNVTVPYKSEVIPYLKEIDPLAKQIGAVNTLVHTDGGYKGYNTDMPGLYRAMCSDGIQIEGEEIILLGAGGVARAIAFLLLEKGAKHVIILNRNKERAKNLTDEVNEAVRQRKTEEKTAFPHKMPFAAAYALEEYREINDSRQYLVIQATNVGMFPHTEHAVIEDESFYRLVKAGYDVIFNPLETRFMRLVRQAGGEAYHGLKMLLYQGLIAYELWNDILISGETAEVIYRKMEKALGV